MWTTAGRSLESERPLERAADFVLPDAEVELGGHRADQARSSRRPSTSLSRTEVESVEIGGSRHQPRDLRGDGRFST